VKNARELESKIHKNIKPLSKHEDGGMKL